MCLILEGEKRNRSIELGPIALLAEPGYERVGGTLSVVTNSFYFGELFT